MTRAISCRIRRDKTADTRSSSKEAGTPPNTDGADGALNKLAGGVALKKIKIQSARKGNTVRTSIKAGGGGLWCG
jgi:hypothetical protein